MEQRCRVTESILDHPLRHAHKISVPKLMSTGRYPCCPTIKHLMLSCNTVPGHIPCSE